MAAGKRAGSRRAARTTPKSANRAGLHALGITACVIAWGYLVFAAVDFGASARAGNTPAWLLLALAAIGAAACLFVGIMVALRLLATLGLSQNDPDGNPLPPRPTGGRRAAR